MFRRLNPLILAIIALSLPLFAQEEPAVKNLDPDNARPKWRDENAWPVDYDLAGSWADYGERLSLKAESKLSLAKLAANPDEFAGKKIRLEGRIVAICAKAGCWLTLSDGQREVFVKFKDYGFFVPRHLAGHDVVLEGLAEVSVMTEAQRRHMAEDAGKSPEEIAKIVGDETKLKMMAEAVRIVEPDLIELGKLDAKAVRCELGAIPAEGQARIQGTLIKAEAKSVVIESAGTRLQIVLPGEGLSPEQLARLKAATRPVEVDATGAKVVEGDRSRFGASGLSLRFAR